MVKINNKAASPLTLQDFECSRTLGAGSFVTVVLAKYRRATADGGLVALKQQAKAPGKNKRKAQVEERTVMEELRGAPFCLQLLGSFQTKSFVYLVTEYCGAASLQGHIEEGTSFFGHAVIYLAAEMCDALCYLPGMDVVHRDVKPDNILFDSQGHSKLCDFGLSFRQFWGQKRSDRCGTARFWAPEMVVQNPRYDHMVDWWALGVTLLTLIKGSNPFDVIVPFDSPDYYYYNALKDRVLGYQVPKGLGVGIRRYGLLTLSISALVRDLLVKDPDHRLGSQLGAVRDHPVFHHRLLDFTPDSWEDLRRGLLPPPLQKPEVGHKLSEDPWRQYISMREDPALLDEAWDPYPDYDSNFLGVGSTAQ